MARDLARRRAAEPPSTEQHVADIARLVAEIAQRVADLAAAIRARREAQR